MVFTTLHTATATEIPGRLTDIGLESWLLRAVLSGACSMRLVRKVCPDCAEPYQPDCLEVLSGCPDAKALSKAQYVRGRGCEKCHHSGYYGRTAIFELMPVTSGILDMISKNAGPKEIRQTAVEEGMVTMRHDGIRKAARGITTLEEVLRVTCGIA